MQIATYLFDIKGVEPRVSDIGMASLSDNNIPIKCMCTFGRSNITDIAIYTCKKNFSATVLSIHYICSLIIYRAWRSHQLRRRLTYKTFPGGGLYHDAKASWIGMDNRS